MPPVLHPIEVRERRRHHCFVITLGLHGHFGKQLLKHNRDFLSNAIDTRSLRDPDADQRGGPVLGELVSKRSNDCVDIHIVSH